MSEIKSLSVDNGDMFYINHNTDNFSMIDCNITDERKSEILDEVKNLQGKRASFVLSVRIRTKIIFRVLSILMSSGLLRISITLTIMSPSPRRLRVSKSIKI